MKHASDSGLLVEPTDRIRRGGLHRLVLHPSQSCVMHGDLALGGRLSLLRSRAALPRATSASEGMVVARRPRHAVEARREQSELSCHGSEGCVAVVLSRTNVSLVPERRAAPLNQVGWRRGRPDLPGREV